MGNRISRSKRGRRSAATKKIQPKLDPDQEELEHYLSNNFDSIDRMHMYHFFKRHLFQSNFSSPIENKLMRGQCKILDIGCGPGTWLLDLSNKHENSNFFGIDIKSIFPREIKPNNLEFIEGDIFDGLPFDDETFDFTRVDSMSLIFTAEQWDFVLTEAIRVTKQGGYIEIADKLNEFSNQGPIYHRLSGGIFNSYSKRNVDLKSIHNLDSKIMSRPNIENVHRIEKKVILGPNGGKLGLVFQDLALLYLGNKMAIKILSRELGISEEEYINMINNDLIEELEQTSPENIHVRFWAQKKVDSIQSGT